MRPTRLLAAVLPLLLLGAAVQAQEAASSVFVALDIETTGFSPERDRIVEIAAVRFGATPTRERTWLVNPNVPIPLHARKVHGITDAMVADAPRFADVYPQLQRFAAGCVVIAHNARFDLSFLAAEARRNDLAPLRAQALDTLQLARHWFPEAPDHKLPTLAEHLNLEGSAFHRAAADADYARRVFLAGLARLPANVTLDELAQAAGGWMTTARDD